MSVCGAKLIDDIVVGARGFFGRRCESDVRVLQPSKDIAMQEMMQRAQAMGANAIVGIDLDYETIGGGNSMLMVATSGTAVVI